MEKNHKKKKNEHCKKVQIPKVKTISEMKNWLRDLYIILGEKKGSVGNVEAKLIETNLPWKMGGKKQIAIKW